MRWNLRHILGKLLSLFVTLFVVITTTFVLMKSIPGDPLMQEKAVPPEIMAAMRAHYGLDDPWYVQYLHYLKSVATLNLGPSFKYEGRSVNDIIKDGFPISALLGLEALLISIACGITLGTIAALRQNHWQDYLAMGTAILGISIPSFIIATLLQYFLAMQLDLFPIARWGTFSHTVLPAISLAALPSAFIARLTRSSMLEVLQQDYIKTAKAKGISTWQVTIRHALPNALLPVVTYLGQLTASIFVGSFVIERIFGIPGLGQWFVNSVTNRDYTVIMGTTVFYSVFLLSAVFLVDILYTFLDPRMKHR